MLLCLLTLGGVPHPVLDGGGTPTWTWDGVPQSRSGMGYSPHQLDGVPLPHWTWEGVPSPSRPGMGYPPSRPGMGVPPTWTWDGVPPHLDLGWGTPLLAGCTPPKCGQTHRLVSKHYSANQLRQYSKHYSNITQNISWMYPPPQSVDRHTDSCQNITFPRTSYTGSKYYYFMKYLLILHTLADPGGALGARAPPDPQIWRPQLYNLEAQCTIEGLNNEF